MNQITLSGRLVREPELTETKSGIAMLKNAIAVNRKFDREKADFFNFVAWRGTAEFIENYAKKGAECLITGRMETNEYESNGETKKSFQVVVDSFELFYGPKENKDEVVKKEDDFTFETKTETKEADNSDVPWELEL